MLYPHSSLSVFLSHGLLQIWQAKSAWLLLSFAYNWTYWSGFIERWGEGGKRHRDRETDRKRDREGFTGKGKAKVQRVMRAAGFDPHPPGVAPWGVWTPVPGSQVFKHPQVWCGNSRRPWRISISVVTPWPEARGSSQQHRTSLKIAMDFGRSGSGRQVWGRSPIKAVI